MIAVIDMTQDGWGFVGTLHRLGFAVSWVVGRNVDVGFDALPSGFRGVVHPLGFDDRSQIKTAILGCEAVVMMGGDGKNLPALLPADLEVPVYLVSPMDGAYEVKLMEREARGREAQVPAPSIHHFANYVR